ncbi:MAG: CHAT domain-containing protein [Ardenticatenales bacterium]|nr:CHAT domain-containing protein [Ardenticatenales bacterium]
MTRSLDLDLDAIARHAQREILVLSANQTVASAVRAIGAARPAWVVVVREEDWEPRPYLYAYRPLELVHIVVAYGPDTLSLRAALNLQEKKASAVGTAGEPAPTPSDTTGSASRIVTVDAERVPIRVDETAPITRGGLRPPSPPPARPSAPSPMPPSPLPPSPPGGSGPPTSGGPPTRGLPTSGPPPAGPSTAAPTIDMRIGTRAPAAVTIGTEDVIDVIVADAADAITLPGSVTATGSATEPIVAILTLLGDAVTVVGPSILRLDPPKPGAPSQSAFVIRGVAEGAVQAAVIFRQGGTELGNMRHQIRATAQSTPAVRAAGTATGAQRAVGDGGVLLLQIDPITSGTAGTAGTDIRFRYRVHCADLGLDFQEFESPKLLASNGTPAESLRAYVAGIYDQMTNQILRTQDQVNRFRREVEAFGVQLCGQLFPADLAAALWDGRAKITAVRVMSWEPFIPWELIRLKDPKGRDSDDRFLGQYGLVRWLPGRSAARSLPLKDWSFLAATYPNNPADNVTGEVAYFTATLPQRGIQPVQVASTYDAFVEALENPTFDVLHVACHGEAKEDNIDKAVLVITDELVNGRTQSVSITADVVAMTARFGDRRPLVFLNACEAGRLGESLTAWGGWPKRLIDAGAGAVVGASWPVRDVASNTFATAFYDALIGGKTLAEAASEARGAASGVGDGTWLAFKVFGDPHGGR